MNVCITYYRRLLMVLLFFFSLLLTMVNGQLFYIKAYAGNSSSLYSGDNGFATSASLRSPYSAFIDTIGNLFISDSYNQRIRKVTASTNIITTIAGMGGTCRLGGDGGPATSAYLCSPSAIWVSTTGIVYFADTWNHRIRTISNTTGFIKTFAGMGVSSYNTGDSGYYTDGVAATASYLSYPYGVFGDTNNNIYLSDTGNNRVRKVAPDGIITSLTSTGNPRGLFVTTDGTIYFADYNNHYIRKIATNGIVSIIAGNYIWLANGDGGLATVASIRYPESVWVNTNGVIYIADTGNHRIRKVHPTTRIITTIAGKEFRGGGWAYGGDNGPSTSAYISEVYGLLYDKLTNAIFFADIGNGRIRKHTISTTSTVTTYVSSSSPYYLVIDATGFIYFTDTYYVKKISPSTKVITIVAGTGSYGYNNDGIAASSAILNSPMSIYLDTNGIVYVVDTFNYRIRKIDTLNIIYTFCGNGSFGSLPDGTLATSMMIRQVTGLTGDTIGNIYFTEASYHRVRMIDSSNIVSTLVGNGIAGYSSSHEGVAANLASLNSPRGLWCNSNGELFIADYLNRRLRKVTAAGSGSRIITTIAGNGNYGLVGDGNVPTSASLSFPYGVTGDTLGNLYVIDTYNYRIRKVDTVNNIITSILGGGLSGVSGVATEDVLSIESYLNSPTCVNGDSNGNLYIADKENQKVRMLIPDTRPSSQPSSQPSKQPLNRPSSQPSRQPSSQPSRQPMSRPSGQPSHVPSSQPSCHPTVKPTSQPTIRSTSMPSGQPSSQPSRQPLSLPSSQPTMQPISRPTSEPTNQPSIQPSSQPTWQPSFQPQANPTTQPTIQPSLQPVSRPTRQPTSHPTNKPFSKPSSQPTRQPSCQPTSQPSQQPSKQPTSQPTIKPQAYPSTQPSSQPSGQPTSQPTNQPTGQPLGHPSGQPSSKPSNQPQSHPSNQPTRQPTSQPTRQPTVQPTNGPLAHPSSQPISQPSIQPTTQPSAQPTIKPSFPPTGQPSSNPSSQPQTQPSCQPSRKPTSQPTIQPSSQPTLQPAGHPTQPPFSQPTNKPQGRPSNQPSCRPSSQPTSQPTMLPIDHPTQQPTSQPTIQPLTYPSGQQSTQPIQMPTSQPTEQPTQQPIAYPTKDPTGQPSSLPTSKPSRQPSIQPVAHPTTHPTFQPSHQPHPSYQPTAQPSCQPTKLPSMQPASVPTMQPTSQPTMRPSSRPLASVIPSSRPSAQPTAQPFLQPSSQPSTKQAVATTVLPTLQPQSYPTAVPSLHPITSEPMLQPTVPPSVNPSIQPTPVSTDEPKSEPTLMPSLFLTIIPSTEPTAIPSFTATISPTINPTIQPTFIPSTTTPTSTPFSAFHILQLISASFCDHQESCIVFMLNTDINIVDVGSGIFPCNKMFTWQQLSLDSPACKLINTQQIVSYDVQSFDVNILIGLSNTSTLNVVKVCPNVSVCSSSMVLNTTHMVPISSGNDPMIPHLIVKPNRFVSVGKCEDVTIDLTASGGYVGKRWKGWNVTVHGGIDVSFANITVMRDAMTKALSNALTMTPFVISRHYLFTSAYPYEIDITMCNTLNRCSFVSLFVNITDSTSIPPTVDVIGSRARTIVRSSSLSIAIMTSRAKCSADNNVPITVSAQSFNVLWEIFRSENQSSIVSTSLLSLKSISSDKMKFVLPSYSLESGQHYVIRVTVSDPSNPDLSAMTRQYVNVYVKVSPLVPIIMPNQESISYRLGDKAIELNALSSYDPDRLLRYNESMLTTKFTFAWRCAILSSLDWEAECDEELLSLNQSSSMLRMSFATFNESAIDKTFLIILIMAENHGFSSTQRNSSKSVQIKVIPPQAPLINIQTLKSSVTKINVKNRLILTGSVFTKQTCRASWSFDGASIGLNLANIISSTYTKLAFPNIETFVTLSIKTNVLPPIEASYPFTLSCSGSSTLIVVTTNGVPSGGTYTISPREGVELTTMFSMIASQWYDEDLPLSYQFGYYTTVSRSEMVIRSRLELSFASSMLPAGDIMDTFVTVFDSLQATNTTVSSVKVTTLQSTDLERLMTEKLSQSGLLTSSSSSNSSTTSLTVEELKQLVSVSSSALNRVNCTQAPDCISLNRGSCGNKPNTCGHCLTGYVGEEGDSNTPCVSMLQLSLIETIVKECRNDSDCYTWEQCLGLNETMSSSQQCVEKLKTCPQDCSGHGYCTYIDALTGGSFVVTGRCTIFSTSCEAQCACNEGYVGSSCALTTEELEGKQRLREALISGVSQILSSTDIDDQSIISAASTLQSVTAQSDELSMSAVSKANQLANTIVQQALAYQGSTTVTYQSIVPVLAAVDSAVTKAIATSTTQNKENTISLLSQSIDNVDRFGDIIFRDDLVGENATTFLYNNFRLASQAFTMLSTPQSELDKLQQANASASIHALVNRTTTTQTVHSRMRLLTYADATAPMSDGSDIKRQLQAVELKKRLWMRNDSSASMHSNIIVVKTMNVEAVQVVITRLKAATNHQQVENLSAVNLTTVCRQGEVYNESFICPDSRSIITASCTGVAGVQVVFCPISTLQCGNLDLTDQSIIPQNTKKPQCHTVNVTTYDVTCECSIPQKPISFASTLTSLSSASSYSESSNGGGMWSTGISAIDKSGGLAVVLMVQYVASDMVDTFKAAPDALSSAEDTEKVLTVILVYSVMWAMGVLLIGLFAWQRYWKDMKNEKIRSKKVLQHQLHQQRQRRRNVGSQVLPSTIADVGKLLDVVPTSVVQPAHLKQDNQEEMEKTLLSYVYCVIPEVFHTSSTLLAMKVELLRHHSYMQLFVQSDPTKLPILTVCQLLTIQTASMFLLAVLYDVQGPNNDGSCALYKTETTCLQTESVFDYQQTYCRWELSTSETASASSGVCVYNPIEMNFKIALYCAIIVSLFTSLLLYPLEYLFMLLNAPLQQSSSEVALPSVDKPSHASEASNHNSHSHSHMVKYIPSETIQAHNQARLSMVSVVDRLHNNSHINHHHSEAKEDSDWKSKTQALDAPNNRFLELSTKVFQTRNILLDMIHHTAADSKDLILFDSSWGLNQDNIPQALSLSMEHGIDQVNLEYKHVVSTFTSANEDVIGLEILQLFVRDILGRDTSAAKIFKAKTEQDYVSMPIVNIYKKVIAGFVLFLFNAFCVYYSILRGYRKGLHWQRTFMMACIMQFVIEVFYSETLECLYIHCLYPTMVSKEDIKRIQRVIHQCIQKVCKSSMNGNSQTVAEKSIVNAPEYFFVSHQIAKEYPLLIESMIVASCKSIVPVSINVVNVLPASTTVGSTGTNWLARYGIKVLSMTLSVIAIIPLSIQKVLIRFLEPLLWGGFSLMWISLVKTNYGIIVFVIIVVLITMYISYRYYQEYQNELQQRQVLNSKSEVKECSLYDEVVDYVNKNRCSSNEDDEDKYCLSHTSSSLSIELSTSSLVESHGNDDEEIVFYSNNSSSLLWNSVANNDDNIVCNSYGNSYSNSCSDSNYDEKNSMFSMNNHEYIFNLGEDELSNEAVSQVNDDFIDGNDDDMLHRLSSSTSV